jgi:Ni/Fe-hydrogenase subunit HybB-like protein
MIPQMQWSERKCFNFTINLGLNPPCHFGTCGLPSSPWLTLGIGAISDLSYSYPWGFWISFDLFTGVVISSGGFLMAGSVYILGIEEFKPLLRPSILTAFLGYIMVAVALLVDLGQPAYSKR